MPEYPVERLDEHRRTFLYVLREGEIGDYPPVTAETREEAIRVLFDRERTETRCHRNTEIRRFSHGVVIIGYEG